MRKLRIYVAGRLNDIAVDYLRNVHRMLLIAEQARLEGFSVYVPALDMLMGVMFGYWEYSDYFDNSQPWLEQADAVLIQPVGEKESKGVQAEKKRAKELRIPVFDSLSKMIAWADKEHAGWRQRNE